MSKYSKASILADDWNYFSKLGLKIMFTNPMVIRENQIKLSSTMNHTNRSWTFKKPVFTSFFIYFFYFTYN
jgi:hypothetical protein